MIRWSLSRSFRPIVARRLLVPLAVGLMIVGSQNIAFADACQNESDFSKTGELSNPQEGQTFSAGAQVFVDGYWDNPSKVLHVEVLDGATGQNQVMEVDVTSAASATVFNCTPAGSACPVNKNQYYFSVDLAISSSLGPGQYRIRVHREGTPCNFAKPISNSCYNSCTAGGGTYCDCTAGGKDGTCGTGYRNVLVNQQ
jgi:hypothetical protein